MLPVLPTILLHLLLGALPAAGAGKLLDEALALAPRSSAAHAYAEAARLAGRAGEEAVTRCGPRAVDILRAAEQAGESPPLVASWLVRHPQLAEHGLDAVRLARHGGTDLVPELAQLGPEALAHASASPDAALRWSRFARETQAAGLPEAARREAAQRFARAPGLLERVSRHAGQVGWAVALAAIGIGVGIGAGVGLPGAMSTVAGGVSAGMSSAIVVSSVLLTLAGIVALAWWFWRWRRQRVQTAAAARTTPGLLPALLLCSALGSVLPAGDLLDLLQAAERQDRAAIIEGYQHLLALQASDTLGKAPTRDALLQRLGDAWRAEAEHLHAAWLRHQRQLREQLPSHLDEAVAWPQFATWPDAELPALGGPVQDYAERQSSRRLLLSLPAIVLPLSWPADLALFAGEAALEATLGRPASPVTSAMVALCVGRIAERFRAEAWQRMLALHDERKRAMALALLRCRCQE